jgi:signal transduction histidine kinase
LAGGTFLALTVSGPTPSASPTTILELLVGWSFVACGVYAWGRRPDNPIGRIMAAVGLAWLVGRALHFGGVAWSFTAGVWLTDMWPAGLALFLLAYPGGRRMTGSDQTILGLFLLFALPLELAWLVVWDPASGPGNALAVWPNVGLADGIDGAQRVVVVLAILLLIATLAHRWYVSTAPMRRMMTPILAGGFALLIGSMTTVLAKFGISAEPMIWSVLIAYIAVPIAVVGVTFRARMARGALAELVIELGTTPAPARLQDALAHALADPSLQVAFWSRPANAFLGTDGAPVPMPPADSRQVVTVLERGGIPLAAIIHDAALLDDPGLVASVATAVRLTVENERLQAEVEAQLEEVRASRARIVAAGDAERKRLERDLHDGAQQRLVALMLALRIAQGSLESSEGPGLRLTLAQASAEAKAALSELRDLAQGIHPQILSEAGLETAVESLADRAQVPVTVEIGSRERYVPAVESAAYFVVAEALTNVTKYAVASHVLVRAAWRDGILTLEVSDDGIGGADPSAGSGLRGLVDRLAVIDGTLEVVSPTGGGTRLLAQIPSAAPTMMPG